MMIDELNPVIEFTADARCDRCGAQAYFHVSKRLMELLFCKHHWDEVKEKFKDSDWIVTMDALGYSGIDPHFNLYDAPV